MENPLAKTIATALGVRPGRRLPNRGVPRPAVEAAAAAKRERRRQRRLALPDHRPEWREPRGAPPVPAWPGGRLRREREAREELPEAEAGAEGVL